MVQPQSLEVCLLVEGTGSTLSYVSDFLVLGLAPDPELSLLLAPDPGLSLLLAPDPGLSLLLITRGLLLRGMSVVATIAEDSSNEFPGIGVDVVGGAVKVYKNI